MGLVHLFLLCGLVGLPFAQASGSNTTAPSPIPIAVGGKDPVIAKMVVQLMLPEYDGMSRQENGLVVIIFDNQQSSMSFKTLP